MTDQIAIRNAAMNDQAIDTHWKQIYAHLRARCFCSHHEAEDLTQELFSRLIARGALDGLAGRFSTGAEMRHYLFAAARNLHKNHHRQASRLKRGGGFPTLSLERDGAGRPECAAKMGSPAEEVERRELREHWEREIEFLSERIPPRRRAMFALFRDSLEPERRPRGVSETAAALGVTPVALRVQIHRWRENLFGKMRVALSA